MSKLRVWWIPQVPMNAFRIDVGTIQEASKIMTVLADYDAFQYNNNIKPDYSNVGGLEMLEGGEWTDWYIDDDEVGYYDDLDEYLEAVSNVELPEFKGAMQALDDLCNVRKK